MSNSNHKVISDPSEGSICVAAGVGRNQCHYRITWMMINHSTLEYHVTNFNTFFRWLWRKNQNPNTLL